MTSESKDATRVAAGLKAAINNPRNSEEAKENAQERLQDMGADSDVQQGQQSHQGQAGKVSDNVLRGHKATLSNPRTSDRAKEHSEEILEEAGAL